MNDSKRAYAGRPGFRGRWRANVRLAAGIVFVVAMFALMFWGLSVSGGVLW